MVHNLLPPEKLKHMMYSPEEVLPQYIPPPLAVREPSWAPLAGTTMSEGSPFLQEAETALTEEMKQLRAAALFYSIHGGDKRMTERLFSRLELLRGPRSELSQSKKEQEEPHDTR